MDVRLLEREEPLNALDALLGGVAVGAGRTVLIGGEPGIGKTSLVECFLERHAAETRVLWGACEALFTPRPLGPLYDIAQQAQTPLRAILEGDASRAALFAAVLDELVVGATPPILVIEDIHWADEATLDLIKFLARRVHRTHALLILTLRDNELTTQHPLRQVLGDLPARDLTRLTLAPLSEAAVAVLARQSKRMSRHLYEVTGGNPFFVNEALASSAPGVPMSVSDAVLAQVARRSSEARNLLELVAIAPTKVAEWAIETVYPACGAALEECLSVGMLHHEDAALRFRHELARQAIERSLSPSRRKQLHTALLQALIEHGAEYTPLARLAHHAVQAEDGALVLRFAPAAAAQASSQGAHREAAAHYATTIHYAESLDAEQRAELLDAMSSEYYLMGRFPEASEPRKAALEIWRNLGRLEKMGHDLRRLSRLSWFLGIHVEAEQQGIAAVEILESLPTSRELAMAYANMAHLRMLQDDFADTAVWGARAIDLAERLDDSETLSYALNNVGAALLSDGNEEGWAQLERSLEVALKYGYEEHVARAYSNLANHKIALWEYAQATDYIERGLAYCVERDLGSWWHCLLGHRACTRLNQGDWVGAEEDTGAILGAPWADGTNRIPALIILSQLRARRGDPGVEAALDEVRDLACTGDCLESVLVVAVVRAEWRWLQGDLQECAAEAETALRLALPQTYPWHVGELAIWLWRAGTLAESPCGVERQFALQTAGDWRGAAMLWAELGYPYEQALALMDGDETAQREALTLFERLGAAPAAEIARRQLRLAGARGLPRGPRPATQANPLNLTNRQLEVLQLLAEGLHNTEIAERLSTTPKTVEHHVSAVLAKLDARSRSEAARMAMQMGLISESRDLAAAKIGA